MTEGVRYIDELSGAYNRKYLEEEQKGAALKLIAHQIPFSVVMVDIDHFKEINDMHGHLKGDEVMKEFARFLNEELRKSDTVIRYGGDEFTCVMPNTTRQDAESIYRRILKKCKGRQFSGLQISLSVGVASYPRDADDFDGLLKIADQVLYEAKRSGRGRLGTMLKKRIELPTKVFLDRTDEQYILKHFLGEAREGLSVAIIKGNVGIGKTRLTKEVLGAIKGREIIWSDCLFLADSIAYYPVRELIKYRIQRLGVEAFGDIPSAYRLEIAKLVPEIGTEIAETQGVSPVQDKYRLYEGVRKILEVGARPKVVVVDNIQWIDQESIEVIKYLIRALKQSAIVCVLIYRVEEETDRLKDFLLSVNREVDVKEVSLSPLTRTDIKVGLQAIIGEEPEPALLDYVIRESGGIPFYIEETVRGLYTERYLVIEDEKWVFREPDKEIVPKTLEDITLRKYHSMSKEAQSVLDAASVIGRFDVDILTSLTTYNEGEIVGFINDISRLGLVKYTQDRFEFAEEMSRNALYKRNVEGIKGMTLHRQAGDRIEEMHAGKEYLVVEELAYHCYRGRVLKKGVKYCMQAGAAAQNKYALRNAIQYYTWALDLLKDEVAKEFAEKKIDCLHKRAWIFNTVGETDAALRDVEDGLEIACSIRDREREIALLLMKGEVYECISQYREAIDVAEKCRTLCDQIGKREQLASSLQSIAFSALKLGDYEKATQCGEKSLDINRELKDRVGEASMLNFMGIIEKTRGRFREALNYYESSRGIVQEEDHKTGIAGCMLNAAVCDRMLGQFAKALDRNESALRIAREIGDAQSVAMACYNMGLLYADLGEPDKALEFLQSSLRLRREISYRAGEVVNLGIMGVVYGRLGQFDRALKFFEEALALAREIGDKHTEALLLDARGLVFLTLGDYLSAREHFKAVVDMLAQVADESVEFGSLLNRGSLHLALHEIEQARQFFKKAEQCAESIGSQFIMKDVLTALCVLSLEEGKLEDFKTLLERINDLPEEVKTKPHQGAMNVLLGRFYTLTEDFIQAEKSFEKASLIYADLKEPLNIGKTYYYRGKMEIACTKDAERANRFFQKAVDIFTSIGARSWQKKAEKALVE